MWPWIIDHSKTVLGLLAAIVWIGAVVWYIVISKLYKDWPSIPSLYRGWRDRRFNAWNDPNR